MAPRPNSALAPSLRGNRRRRRLVVPRFQVGMMLAFGGIALVGLMLEVLLVAVQLGALEQRMPTGGTYLATEVPRMVGSSLGLSLVLVLPALLVVGLRLTFRWAGPIYRIQQHCEAIAEGREPGPLRLRAGDELHELAAAVEAALESRRGSGEDASPASRADSEEREAA